MTQPPKSESFRASKLLRMAHRDIIPPDRVFASHDLLMRVRLSLDQAEASWRTERG